MENVQLFNKISDNVIQHDTSSEPKAVNNLETCNSNLSNIDLCLGNRQSNFPDLQMFGQNKDVKFPGKIEKDASSDSPDKTLNFSGTNETLEHTEDSLTLKLSCDRQRNIIKKESNDKLEREISENHISKFNGSIENSVLSLDPVAYRETKKRKFDELIEKKFGIERKKAKLSTELKESQKATNGTNAKTNNQILPKEIIVNKKDDVYSFEDELDSNENAEFSYQSFDKNVLHKRKTSAKFPSSKRSEFNLDKHKAVKDFDETLFEVNRGETSFGASPIESTDTNIVPFTSKRFGADFSNELRAAGNEKNMPESKVKDKFTSENKETTLLEQINMNPDRNQTDKLKSKVLHGLDCSASIGMSPNVNNKFVDAECDNAMPLMGNLSTTTFSNMVQNVETNSGDTATIAHSTVYNGGVRNTSQDSARTVYNNSYNAKDLTVFNGSSKSIDKTDHHKGQSAVGNSKVYNGVSKIGHDKAVYINGSRKLSFDTANGSSKISQHLQYNGSLKTGAYERMLDRGQRAEKYLGMNYFRPPFNGKVIDKRLEAIRKVSLWIGDCMDSSAGDKDSPEDLSMDKNVPKAQGQKNGIHASLSETFMTSSVKTKCASTDVKCATSKSLLRSKCAENLKLKCESKNKKKKCETENGKLKCVQNVKKPSPCVKNGRFSTVNTDNFDVTNFKDEKCAGQRKINSVNKEQAKTLSEFINNITVGNLDKKPSEFSAFDVQRNVEQATGELDLKFETSSKEQGSAKVNQLWFNSKSRTCSIESRHLYAPQNSDVLSKSLSQNGRKTLASTDVMSKKLQKEYKQDFKNLNSRFDGTSDRSKDNNKEDGFILSQDFGRRQETLNNEQIEGFESACIDLAVNSFDEQSNKASDKKIVSRNAVETHYGAEVWGLGNDVYNINADVININGVKKMNGITCFHGSQMPNYHVINVEDAELNSAEFDETDKGKVVSTDSKDSGIAECLETQRRYIESASSRSGSVVGIGSNKISDKNVYTDRGNNRMMDYTVNTVNFGDTSSFSLTPEDFKLTYPDVVNIDTETQNEPLDLHVNLETIENVKDFSAGSVPKVKREVNIDDVLIKSSGAESLSEVQAQAVFTECKDNLTKFGESQNLNIEGYVKNKSEKVLGSETSPQISVIKPVLTNGFSSHDWSADDLASFELDNIDEDHSLENINPVSIVDDPVSIAGSLVSLNPVSVGVNPVSNSNIVFSAENDSFANYPVSRNGNPVSNDGSSSFSSISDNISNQFPNTDNSGNQLQNIADNADNQISNIGNNVGNQFPNINVNGNQFQNITDDAGNQISNICDNVGNQFPLDDELVGESEDYQWNETLKSFIMQNLENEPKEENGVKEAAADVELLLEQKLAEQYLNRNIESLKKRHSID